MNRKIIDYIVVEVRKDPNEHNQHYSLTNQGEALNISLNIKNIEYGILIQENKKILPQEVIKYIDKLLNTVEDFSTYKASENDVLFYREKHTDSHPLTGITSYAFLDENEDEYYRIELNKQVQKQESEIASIDKKIAIAKSEIQKLKIKENTILENNKTLDFETFRTDFEKTVLYYLEKGYEPQGGIATRYDNYYTIYCQAMVKYED
ncbi:hypothetical protein [Flavobacterium sp. XS1P27]|uniref:hypothetical protein n=1 Tax=Flavobacterium sp. XS1P27 TaxID=3401724 RepID=UPI003AAC6033